MKMKPTALLICAVMLMGCREKPEAPHAVGVDGEISRRTVIQHKVDLSACSHIGLKIHADVSGGSYLYLKMRAIKGDVEVQGLSSDFDVGANDIRPGDIEIICEEVR